jgi:hypothetical protein
MANEETITEYKGNLVVAVYETHNFSADDAASIEAGNYPVILAQNGEFTKLYVPLSELAKYSHWDAKDDDAEAQRLEHGVNIPIVWDGLTETGLEHKVVEQETPAE